MKRITKKPAALQRRSALRAIFAVSSIRAATFFEVLIAVAIIVVLAVYILLGIVGGRESAKTAKAGLVQRQLGEASGFYFADTGFYPPDVNRGWDPGFVRSLPWNPDTEAGDPPPGGFATSGTNCSHCPTNWQDVVQAKWSGPYITTWPRFTPWKGKYDYNYWATGTVRYGCTVPPGAYIGAQGDYNNKNTIPAFMEQMMINKNLDADLCINGESQMLLHPIGN